MLALFCSAFYWHHRLRLSNSSKLDSIRLARWFRPCEPKSETSIPSFLLRPFLSPQKMNDDYLTILFLILSAFCTIVWLWLDNQRIKACRQVWNLYALPSALVAGGSVLSLHGGEGLSDTGGRIFGCSDYSYALPMPLNLARTVCVPTTLWGCADSAYKRADSADKCRQKCRVQTVVHINDKFVYTS